MSFRELGRIIDQLVKDRGIKRELIISAIEQAFLVTAKRKYGLQGEYEAKYNKKDDDIEIFQYKNVVNEIKDPILELSLEEARNIDENCDIGDQLGLKIENPEFTRVDVQTVKQIILQKVRDAERDILFKEFKHREGELITGIVRRQERGNYVIDLGKAEAMLSRKEIIPGEEFRPGDRVQAYLSEVIMTNRGPEICLTRTSPMFLVKLFEVEVPEIQDGTIEIKSAAREPGFRAKMAVYTTDKEIDPVGACVGMRGSRVQNVVNELQGEKIDIVKWSPDIETFVRSSLAPAEITSIMHSSTESSTLDVIVEENQLSLAIGKKGQNVRLAAILTGRKVNIISKTKIQDKIRKAVTNFMQLPSISDAMAQMLVNEGIMSLETVIKLDPKELAYIVGTDQENAAKIIEEITILAREGSLTINSEEVADLISASASPMKSGPIQSQGSQRPRGDEKIGNDRFSETEKRLREELAAFKLK